MLLIVMILLYIEKIREGPVKPHGSGQLTPPDPRKFVFATLSFNHQSFVLTTADVFHFFIRTVRRFFSANIAYLVKKRKIRCLSSRVPYQSLRVPRSITLFSIPGTFEYVLFEIPYRELQSLAKLPAHSRPGAGQFGGGLSCVRAAKTKPTRNQPTDKEECTYNHRRERQTTARLFQKLSKIISIFTILIPLDMKILIFSHDIRHVYEYTAAVHSFEALHQKGFFPPPCYGIRAFWAMSERKASFSFVDFTPNCVVTRVTSKAPVVAYRYHTAVCTTSYT